ncbi:RNA polymerase sigma-70 factor [Bacteroides sp. 519]|uniref:RNA polymerase sigma-70 factor n=1 Tax=Bacteroides sp. 519 TaxID=2302937 RepID=UPI0013D62CBF|nr:RNA polymerase sigma-70 factor [Bacteroides sp. 519]NDV58898.1 RNA polymerase sigma-70 factor [Bacteroides sp. 519]
MTDTEKAIIEGLAAGCEEAYKYIYNTHYQALCMFAAQYVPDDFMAETIVGDVIFHIWQNRQTLTITQSLRNYLLTAVKNRCLNYLEFQHRQQALINHTTEKLNERQLNYEAQTEYPLTALLEKELDVKITRALNKLPQQTRHIFLLSRFSNLKYQEIAQQTGTSVDVVKYHIKSALARLRDELKEYLITILVLFSLFL